MEGGPGTVDRAMVMCGGWTWDSQKSSGDVWRVDLGQSTEQW